MKLDKVLAQWQGGLIVSCQAAEGSPLAAPEMIAALALTAAQNGAVGVRIDGATNIREVRKAVTSPILGIEKAVHQDSDVYITPTYEAAQRVAASGADVIALDATMRQRPNGEGLSSIIKRIKAQLDLPVMADVATYEDGMRAVEVAGADLISTTLAGYTPETASLSDRPDLKLIERLAASLDLPVIGEGRLRNTEDVKQAFNCGAFAVVIGAAITGVDWLVRHYVAATLRASRG